VFYNRAFLTRTLKNPCLFSNVFEKFFRERDFNAIVFRRKQTYAAVNICTAIKPTHKYSRPPRY